MRPLLGLVVSCALFVPSPSLGQIESGCSQDDLDYRRVILQSVIDCVRRNAVALERSKETPENIATASIGLCRKGLFYLRGACGGEHLADYAEKQLPSIAIAEVVKRRAQRSTK